jgi:hypothetical protein
MIGDPTSLRIGHNSSEEEIQSFGFNGNYKSRNLDCNPNEPQMEHDANETYVILASVSSTLTVETMLRILAKCELQLIYHRKKIAKVKSNRIEDKTFYR